MKTLPALALAALTLTVPAAALAQEGWGIAADIGLGATYQPQWLGSKDMTATPWAIFRNMDVTRPGQGTTSDGSAQGLQISPTFKYRGGRDSGDSAALKGLDKIKPTIEAGAKLRYTIGPANMDLILRKGVGGHDGIAGSIGGRYRFNPSERLTMWAGARADFGDRHFTRTYFGVTEKESQNSGYASHAPKGGFYAASIGLDARYAVNDRWAVLAEAEYTRLIGDAADAPFIERKSQPSFSVGVVRRFDFRF